MRCGNYIFRGEETPIGSKMFKNKLGHDCRLAGSTLKGNIWFASIYIYDTKEFIEIEFNKIEKYIK